MHGHNLTTRSERIHKHVNVENNMFLHWFYNDLKMAMCARVNPSWKSPSKTLPLPKRFLSSKWYPAKHESHIFANAVRARRQDNATLNHALRHSNGSFQSTRCTPRRTCMVSTWGIPKHKVGFTQAIRHANCYTTKHETHVRTNTAYKLHMHKRPIYPSTPSLGW